MNIFTRRATVKLVPLILLCKPKYPAACRGDEGQLERYVGGADSSHKKPAQIPCALGAGLGLFLIFVWQAVTLAASPEIGVWERDWLVWIGPAGNPLLTQFFLGITYLGGAPAVVAFGAFAFFFLISERRARVIFAAAVVGAELLAVLAKLLVRRPRPGAAIVTSYGYGFPSAHALVGLVFYGLIAYLLFKKYKNFWARAAIVSASAIIIILIGYSRLYLGVHWPADILGGWTAGLAILIFVISFLEARSRNLEISKSRNV